MNLKVVLAVVVLAPVAILTGISLSKEPVSCNSVLMERANTADRKMVMQNSDGGLFLLTPGTEPGQVLFIGYVGPKTSEQLRVQMMNAGLSKVHVENDGTCESEGGLEYTIVVGSYQMAAQPDPT